MSLTISDDLLLTMRMTEDEARQEIAVLFYQKRKLTLAQASRLAGMDRMQFQHLLASRLIPINYDVKDFEEDLKNLRKLRSS
jgi:predicted HTH domain antitoxin